MPMQWKSPRPHWQLPDPNARPTFDQRRTPDTFLAYKWLRWSAEQGAHESPVQRRHFWYNGYMQADIEPTKLNQSGIYCWPTEALARANREHRCDLVVIEVGTPIIGHADGKIRTGWAREYQIVEIFKEHYDYERESRF